MKSLKHREDDLKNSCAVTTYPYQKDPEKLIAKLVSYVIQICRMQKANNHQDTHIIAMDETPVWNDMVSETTVDGCSNKIITRVCLFGSQGGWGNIKTNDHFQRCC